jgi:hypothetical protein
VRRLAILAVQVAVSTLEFLLVYVVARAAAWAAGLDGELAEASAFVLAGVNVLLAIYAAIGENRRSRSQGRRL